MNPPEKSPANKVAKQPGSTKLPSWNVDELIDAPRFGWKSWALLLGPGLVMGGSAIGGGEWLTGPMITARYGGGLLWLATLSILGQVIYNLEVSRYTLYTGEPIFTGKFRTLPGPKFWVIIYLLLDFGSIFPYLAAYAATPLATVILGEVPNTKTGIDTFVFLFWEWEMSHEMLLRVLGYVIFLGAMIPLVFGGKIYNALKAIMAFKIFTVLGFLLILGILYSSFGTWTEIFTGFVKFGNVPVRQIEDANGNGILDEGEDWDGDGKLDVMEPTLKLQFGSFGTDDFATDLDLDGKPDSMVNLGTRNKPIFWPDLNEDGEPDKTFMFDTNGDGTLDGPFPLDADGDGKLDDFVDIDNDGIRDGDNLDNIFTSTVTKGKGWPDIDWSMIALLSALVAISGSGGLSNTTTSNYTRDQGWGMGHHVGAIPSVVGAHDLKLSHVGTVFEVNKKSLPRWKRWYRHIVRDQLVVWMPACFLGLALPSMLSVQFLPRGTAVADKWVTAAMTADGVKSAVGGNLGGLFWGMTLFCGFLVLAPSMATSIDGVIRRWVDVFWTTSKTLRKVDPKNIRFVYFTVLALYAVFGLTMLSLGKPENLLVVATTIYNFALGFSCWHTLWVNHRLLPRQLRPRLFVTVSLFLAGVFFWLIATISSLQKFGYL